MRDERDGMQSCDGCAYEGKDLPEDFLTDTHDAELQFCRYCMNTEFPRREGIPDAMRHINTMFNVLEHEVLRVQEEI